MIYYLTVNGVTEKFDNELAYYMKINTLRTEGYSISYESNDDGTCIAVNWPVIIKVFRGIFREIGRDEIKLWKNI